MSKGSQIRALRIARGLTQQEVAQRAGLHQPDLSAIEGGRKARPETIERILSAIAHLSRPSQALEEHRNELRTALENAGLRNIRIFGSTAEGTDHPGSDLDLFAVLPEGSTLVDLVRFVDLAESVVGVNVDIVADDPRSAEALRTARDQAVPL